MFVERKRVGVASRNFTANGDKNGLVTVADTTNFFVKQVVQIVSNTKPPIELEIKRFVNNNSFKVGPRGQPISTYTDLSAYTVADGASIFAAEQDRPGIKPDDIRRAVYAEEPIVAERVISVDKNGNYYDGNNPVPVAMSGGLSPTGYDEVDIIRDSDGDATQYQFIEQGSVTGVINVTYDANKNPIKYTKG